MPPSRATSAASIGPFASAMWKSRGAEPAGSSSLPVTTRRTRGLRITGTAPSPIELITPRSCGRNARPALSTAVPLTMSSPRRPTFLPGETLAIAVTRACEPGSASTHSAGSTASLPAGMGAPVMMRTAAPGRQCAPNGDPGSESPATASGTRL